MLGNFLEKFKRGLSKTREGLSGKISEVLRRSPRLDDEALEEIEEILIRADVGVNATLRIIDRLRERLQRGSAPEGTEEWVRGRLETELLEILRAVQPPSLAPPRARPHVILVAGVNGSGKTTTIGKLACRYGARGNRVLLAACDTFRAAAIEQLSIWAERSGADIVRHRPGADAASVAFDALAAARSRDMDVVIIDTAGRLHTSINLMEELKKICRVLGKCLQGAPWSWTPPRDRTPSPRPANSTRTSELPVLFWPNWMARPGAALSLPLPTNSVSPFVWSAWVKARMI